MALKNRSLFLYGLQVTESNSSIDFRAVALETPRQATLRLGYYSLTSLMEEVVRAMTEVDGTRTYTVTANRSISAGTQNRITISTNGSVLELLFLTGPRNASSSATLLGFNPVDYTGSTTYTGASSAGTAMVPTLTGYNYLSPDKFRKVFGSVNLSASGRKETIIFQVQEFWQVEFKYEPDGPDSDPANFKVSTQWTPLLNWMIQQRPIEFTPDIALAPNSFFGGTLESTSSDGKGLGFTLREMLPEHPNFYTTGLMTFRKGLS